MTIALIAICFCGLMIMLMASAWVCKNCRDIYRDTEIQGYMAFFKDAP